MSWLRRIVDWSVCALFTVLVLATTYAVFMRYFIGDPVHWSEEVMGLLTVWIVMLGAIAAERDGENLSIPIFTDMMPTVMRRLVEVLIKALSLVALVFIAYLAWKLAEKTTYKITQILRISFWWIDIPVAVGSLGMGVYMLQSLITTVKALVKGEDE
ncbi:TRAP transporter small permease [Polycladidibacter hongkongensis]|uniref:TRAP transporter small permease n=1 Tax=Polycladidibacter hongkongensis TaxID=1647556 RepID=UPI0009E9562A|nr:TRAP transporter small permease [Pseudovibrio hongkongensis]